MKIKKIISKKKKKFFRQKKIKTKINCFILKKVKSFKYIFIFIMLLYLMTLRTPLKRRAFDEFKPHKVFIEAHRGVNQLKFQNTKESIELAIKYGLDSVETDLWLSKDNVGVLVHAGWSGELNQFYRNTNCRVFLTNWTELSKLRTKRDNLPMPKLEDIMILAKNKIFINLEIKDPRIDIVFPYITNLIEKYDYFNQISLSSFNHNYYKKIVEYNQNNTFKNKLSFGFIYHEGSHMGMYNFNLKKTSLNLYWKSVTKNVCDKAHANGMAVFAWFYVGENENEEIWQRLFDCGIDIICSNFPLKAKKFRNKYYIQKSYKDFMRKFF